MGEASNTMPTILLFGGTSEGRQVAQWLSARGSCQVVASSLTAYGASLVEGLPRVRSLSGALGPDQMEGLMREGGFACVVDATHPYAVDVSGNIAAAAQACGLEVLRVLRDAGTQMAGDDAWLEFDTVEQAAAHVAGCEGQVLLTTGSKDLAAFVQAMDDYRERLYVRILPVAASIAATEALGIPASHVVAMQGPFSCQLNAALLRELGIRTMVTKASGAAGGFWEKVDAARECAVDVVVIHRPQQGQGLVLDQLFAALAQRYGV